MSAFVRLATFAAALLTCAAPAFAAPVADAATLGAVRACAPARPCAARLPVRVVVVTMFEIGADTGDKPGEFQLAGFNGQAHGLFLKQGHAKRLAENLLQFIRRAVFRSRSRKNHRVQTITPTQIGMDHVTLDGAWPDNGHFNDQIIKPSGLQPGQHGHLGPALHLQPILIHHLHRM